ncbi:Ig-like domain-containing protein [Turneriella parva]|uniref:LTD domain-containing protein n=1 Tax=Turneriella parva (strain ATCC BAA-1111 / DSM 21527 / NCTC 11395 / H) TaxID=869212 RepID=I4B284_TURPD|nr:Ig-like domain-containing protein [Turneriella parva]AFM11391.1 hypothetical protein Turpa_0740 [Turneriella parva DSM 21527]
MFNAKIPVLTLPQRHRSGVCSTVRALVAGLLLATTLMRAQCQQLLEEETDVRVSKQVPDAGGCGTMPTTISIEFSTAMKASTVSAVNAGGACTANVQVSGDNFASCINFSAAPQETNGGTTFAYTPVNPFPAGGSYKIRVKTDAETSSGKKLSHEYTSPSGFGGQAQILITEVGMCRWTNRSCWIEIHNKSSQCTANLSDYRLRSTYREVGGSGFTNAAVNFTLPSVPMAPGTFVVLRGKANNYGDYVNGPGLIYIAQDINPPADPNVTPSVDEIPWWNLNGSMEIIHVPSGNSTDFVRFGASTVTPSGTGGAWNATGMPAMWAIDDANYGKSVARNASLSDSDQGSDWAQQAYATPGAPNDVTCDTDSDNDGIPDCSEVQGSTYSGLNLYAMGARVGQRDIFIEVDYMDSADPGVIPHKAALDKVKAVFNAKGYKLHFDVGDLYHPTSGINEAMHDLGNASARVPFAQGISLGASADSANFFNYKAGHMDIGRRNIFYYMLFAYSRNPDGSAGSSGVAEIEGNDSIVSLGNWGLAADSNRLINYQASTLMHEWGHNLGLRHGGNDDVNYKPNYFSIMNYHYQLAGLPTLNNNPGDRYYLYRRNTFGDCSLITSVSQLTNNFNSATFLMDYSASAGSSITETAISESSGLYYPGSAAVDYNCNGSINGSNINKNLNGTGNGDETLNGFDDWTKVNASGIIFHRKSAGTDSGYFQTIDGEKLHIDPVGNDRQPVVDEPDMAWAREK